jgi:hypothetical protein
MGAMSGSGLAGRGMRLRIVVDPDAHHSWIRFTLRVADDDGVVLRAGGASSSRASTSCTLDETGRLDANAVTAVILTPRMILTADPLADTVYRLKAPRGDREDDRDWRA